MMETSKYKRCFIPSCINKSENSDKIFLHLPKNPSIRSQWFKAVGRTRVPKQSSGYYCCEDHFMMEEDCENWVGYKLFRNKIKMKDDVIPHRYIEEKTDIPRDYSQLSGSAKKRKEKNILEYSAKRLEPSCSRQLYFETQSTSESTVQSDLRPTASMLCSPLGQALLASDKESKEQDISKQKFVDKNIQATPVVKNAGVNTSHNKKKKDYAVPSKFQLKRQFDVEDISSSTSFTTSPSVKGWTTESTSSEEISKKELLNKSNFSEVNSILITEHSRFYLGLPRDSYFLISFLEEEAEINHRNILIILKKIRLNDAYFRLALDFGLTISSISKIINSNIVKLSSYFKTLIFWPSREKIKLNLPIPFRKRYTEIQSIIDCLEIEIETPCNAVHQSLTWSDYKKANTLKYLISALPDGLVNFISCGFGGRITDTEIVEQSGFLEILPENCHVMADRGFKHIQELLHRKSCKLIRPPTVLRGVKSSQSEVRESKRIASLRIHIERVIRRLREFEMLQPHACIDHQLIWRMDHIITIACGLINLQGPLIK